MQLRDSQLLIVADTNVMSGHGPILMPVVEMSLQGIYSQVTIPDPVQSGEISRITGGHRNRAMC